MYIQDKIAETQKMLKEHHIDGWLIYDFQKINPLGLHFLEIPESLHLTRRFFYWIPAEGNPVKIVHQIEPNALNHLPGEKRLYLGWKELGKQLEELLTHVNSLAMEYSPHGTLPVISKVDGGTIEMIKNFHVEVISSAPFLQYFTAVLNKQKFALHKEAATVLEETVDKAFRWIGEHVKQNHELSEYDVRQFILEEFKKRNCVTDGAPICAVGEHSSDPHYSPDPEKSKLIKKGDWILVDLWCKKEIEHGIFADISRVAIADSKPTDRQREIFSIVRKAQKTATDFVKRRFEKEQIVKGFEVDEVCRKVIDDAGFQKYFTHRTGHNIGIKNHGDGTNLDSLETLDERPLIPGTLFSVEPGIYLPGEFGLRLEHDVFIHENGEIEITGGVQEEIQSIL